MAQRRGCATGARGAGGVAGGAEERVSDETTWRLQQPEEEEDAEGKDEAKEEGWARDSKSLNERERERRPSVYVVNAVTVTESRDRAVQPQGGQIEWKPMGYHYCPVDGGGSLEHEQSCDSCSHKTLTLDTDEMERVKQMPRRICYPLHKPIVYSESFGGQWGQFMVCIATLERTLPPDVQEDAIHNKACTVCPVCCCPVYTCEFEKQEGIEREKRGEMQGNTERDGEGTRV
ncbi:hypothetical protein EYF80_015462 [Liparis tanakae]|uniref:Uncharacterized protein n=1 Tax=Liparis tanakae TaxID=230148 RepID=A0A4Z2I827_9TELE|nr:hypothetical protein EYF80_015462 [Liparis tanakae]